MLRALLTDSAGAPLIGRRVTSEGSEVSDRKTSEPFEEPIRALGSGVGGAVSETGTVRCQLQLRHQIKGFHIQLRPVVKSAREGRSSQQRSSVTDVTPFGLCLAN